MSTKIKIKYHGDIPTVDFQSSKENSKVFEILPTGGSRIRRQDVSSRYLTQMDYAFKGVTNSADDYIEEICIEVPNLGINVCKNNSGSTSDIVGDNNSKYRTIIYDIAPGIVTENLYITKGGKVAQRTIVHKKQGIDSEDIRQAISDHLNTDILEKTNENNMATNIAVLMAIVEKYIKGYSLKWNSLLNSFQLVEDGKSTISYNQIKADDTYTFFRVLGLILDKGMHNGIFYIRAESYRSDVIKAMLQMIELLYKDNYVVFLYNADLTCKGMEKEVIELPNYLVMGGK